MSLPSVIIVTGTDTGIGKTMVTAGLAAVLTAAGRTVAIYKPCQSGASFGDSDVDEVSRRVPVAHAENGVTLGEPMAPVAAAAIEGVLLPPVSVHAMRIRALSESVDHVLVEGSGGLLVDLDNERRTLASLGALVGGDCGFVVVARAALGTLNHVALTLEALRTRGLNILGLVIGSWPSAPGTIELSNREYFAAGTVPLLGVVPENVSALSPAKFRSSATTWFDGLTL